LSWQVTQITENEGEMLDAVCASPDWYAIHTRSNFEKRIAADLEAKGIEPYLPSYAEVHQWKDRKKSVQVVLFPGYVFAQFCDSPDNRMTVLRTPGVVRILGQGGGLETVPAQEIVSIQRLLAARVSCFPHPFLNQGQRVRVKHGVLTGLEGTFVRVKNQSRLVLSVKMLSQAVATEVDAAHVEPAPTQGNPK